MRFGARLSHNHNNSSSSGRFPVRRFLDSKGLVTNSRGDVLAAHKVNFARNDFAGNEMKSLVDVINHVKPHALVGLSMQVAGHVPILEKSECSPAVSL